MKSKLQAGAIFSLAAFAVTLVQAELPSAWLWEQMAAASAQARAQFRAGGMELPHLSTVPVGAGLSTSPLAKQGPEVSGTKQESMASPLPAASTTGVKEK